MGSDFWNRGWRERQRPTRWVAVWAFLLAAVGPTAAGGGQHVVAEPVFGGRVFVAEAGLGHPVSLVLLHGVGPEASRIWEPWIPELSPGPSRDSAGSARVRALRPGQSTV